jgi:hypothetical protein
MKYKKHLKKLPLIKKLLYQVEFSTLLQYDAIALYHLQCEMPKVYLPWTGSSVAPSSLRIMLNEIVIGQKTSLIEFGAGMSTVFFARTLKRMGGSMVTIEQDDQWLGIVENLLKNENLDECVDLIHCPINTESNSNWYHKGKLYKALKGRKFDFAFVDAPISKVQNSTVRGPAAAFLQDFLSDNFTLFLDDMNRKGEQLVSDEWQKKYDWCRKDYWPRGTVSAFRAKKAAFNIC